MKWQKGRERIVKYVHFVHRRLRLTVIVWMVSILNLSLASAQEFTLGQEKLLEGIFSPDGNLLAVKTAAGVLVFDASNLRLIQSLSTQSSSVDELVFSPDSRYLAFSEGAFSEGWPGGGVGVWALSTFTQVAYFRLGSLGSSALLFVPDGEMLVALENEAASSLVPYPATVHLWKVGTWEKHGSWNPGDAIHGLAFTHDGKRFVASTARESVHEQVVVDVQTLKPVAVRETRERIIAYSPDGRFEVVVGDWGGDMLGGDYLLVCEPQQHQLIANLSDAVTGYLRFHSISPDSKWLVTVSEQEHEQEQVILWNTQTWEIEHRLKLPIAQGFVKENYWYADLAPTGELRIWDLIKGELLVSSNERYDKTNGEIAAIDVTPDSKWVVAATSDQQVIVWALETHDRVKTIQADWWIDDVQFSSDGLRLAVVTKGVHVWDTTTWKPIALYTTYNMEMGIPSPIAFVPKEHTLAIADIDLGNQNYRIVFWNPDADKVIRETKLMAGPPGQVSSDSVEMASSSQQSVATSQISACASGMSLI